MIVMSAGTKTPLAIGLTLGGIFAGLGTSSALTGPQGGSVHAAGIVTTMSAAQPAVIPIQMAALAIEPIKEGGAAKPEENAASTGGTTDDIVTDNSESSIAKRSANHINQNSGAKWDFRAISQNVVKIERSLKDSTEVNFTDVPLNDAFDYLKELHNIEIWVDSTVLRDEGISIDQTVMLVMSGVSLKSALRLMLEPLNLDYVILNDVLTVTTRAKADETFETRVYNTKRLPELSPKELVEIITTTVEPDHWIMLERSGKAVTPTSVAPAPLNAGNQTIEAQPAATEGSAIPAGGGGGGDSETPLGSIRATAKILVIRQSQRIHEKIVELLDQLELQAIEQAQSEQPETK